VLAAWQALTPVLDPDTTAPKKGWSRYILNG